MRGGTTVVWAWTLGLAGSLGAGVRGLLGFLRWNCRRRFWGVRGARAAAQRATARRRRPEGLDADAGACGLVIEPGEACFARGNVKAIFRAS